MHPRTNDAHSAAELRALLPWLLFLSTAKYWFGIFLLGITEHVPRGQDFTGQSFHPLTEAPWRSVGQDEWEGKGGRGRKKADPQTEMPASWNVSRKGANPDLDERGWQELQSHTERRLIREPDGGLEPFFQNLKSPCN